MKAPGFFIRMATLLILGAGFAFPMAAQSPAQRPQNFDIGDRFFPKLGDMLTDEQRDSLRNAVVAQRDAIRPLQEKLRAARQALLDAALNGKFDENLWHARTRRHQRTRKRN